MPPCSRSLGHASCVPSPAAVLIASSDTLTSYSLSPPPILSVHKESAAIVDAKETSAGHAAPAARTSEQGPPIHSRPACLPRPALDHQVDPCSHCLPTHGNLEAGVEWCWESTSYLSLPFLGSSMLEILRCLGILTDELIG